jgi:hypothetical protein
MMVTPAMFSPVALQCHSPHTPSRRCGEAALPRSPGSPRTCPTTCPTSFFADLLFAAEAPVGAGALFAPMVRTKASQERFEVMAVERLSHWPPANEGNRGGAWAALSPLGRGFIQLRCRPKARHTAERGATITPQIASVPYERRCSWPTSRCGCGPIRARSRARSRAK